MRAAVAFSLRAVLSLVVATNAFAAQLAPTGRAVPGEVLVKIRASASPAAVSNVLSTVDESRPLAKNVSGTIWRMQSRSKDAGALVDALEGNPDVEYAEPNYILQLDTTANDPYLPSLWGLKNTGQIISGLAGFGGSDIDVEAAWGVTTGSASIVVGVVDTGVDYNHPDLAANMWSNPGGKGDPDCAAGTHGFNSINDTCNPMDDHDHGTHVAGTIGAVGNNGKGVTGVNWTTSIMALKFIGSDGYGTTADAIEAIEFAVRAKIDGVNVRVLSNSWGGGAFSRALLDEIHRAGENDILFVAAAGNDATNNDVIPHYPSNYATANMISVAATDNRDGRAYFSNYGVTTVHLGAPGLGILSTIPGNSYAYFNGTSMATPHVAGVAALLLAQSPSLTTADVKSAILNNTDPIASLAGRTTTGGRLNAAKVLGATPSPDFTMSVTPISRTVTRGTSTTYTVTITPVSGFAGAVALSTSTLPSGVTATFNPVTATTTSTLTIDTTSSAPITATGFVITGVSGSLTRATSAGLTITNIAAPSACPAFATPIAYSATTPVAVATGDFNRDGRTDVAVADIGINKVLVRLGSGTGILGAAVSYTTGLAPIFVATGDFNGDGKLDLAVANSGSNDVSILLGNGDGTFAAAAPYAAGASPFALAVADFNGDGDSDLAVANNGASEVSILLGNGNGTFAAAVAYDTASGPFQIAARDFDRDGDADLAVAAFNDDVISILLNNGDGTFAAAVDTPSGGAGPSSVAAGDLNRDGKLDLAVSHYESNEIWILHGNGDGTFGSLLQIAVGANLYSVNLADFNGDGESDLIVANGEGSTLSVLMNNGDGTFATPISLNAGLEPNFITIADFNNDEKPDVVFTNGGYASIGIVLNTSFCTNACGTLAAPVQYGVSGAPFSIVVGDFTRDGRPDVAAATRVGNNVSIINGVEGGFTTGDVISAGTNPDSVTAGDFDNDGDLDLAVANSGSGNASVMLNNGNGTFAAAVNYTAGTTPRSVATADFNRDGDLDLVIATAGSNGAALLLGNGNGTFQAPVPFSAGTTPFSAMPGDFNRDGNPDIAVANSGSANVSILLGNGNATFNTATNYAVGTTPRSIAVDDFNRDGKPDLAVVNAGSNNVSILLGAGNGTFAAAVHYGTMGTSPFHVAAGDITGDGLADLVVANNGSGGASYLAGNGDGTFATALQFPSGIGPAAAAIFDADRDGKLDVAIASSGQSSISIVRNLCPAPDLIVTKSHTDAFAQGSSNKHYFIEVKNIGLAPTTSPISVTDFLPVGMVATAMSGSGWTCSVPSTTCSRTDVLAAGATASAITLTVSVRAVPPTVTNVVKVTGGGEFDTTNNSASDLTAVAQVVDLNVESSHTGSFVQGATGKKYTLTVRNDGGQATSGIVTITDTLPTGMTATGIGGTGWSCSLPSLTCNRSDVLAGNASYPPVTLTVSVAANAPSMVQNSVIVVGGGDNGGGSDSDPTVIWASLTCATFGVPVYYTVPSDATAVANGDFNHDNYPDLAVSGGYYGKVAILLGKADGTFETAVEYAAGTSAGMLAIGDLNEDGHADIVVTNYSSDSITVLIGTGTGAFVPTSSYLTGDQPVHLTLGDFNVDRHLDVAVSNYYSASISLFFGNGNGTFQTGIEIAVGQYPVGIAAGDFNGDGAPDLAVGLQYEGEVAVLINDGDGGFAAGVHYDAEYGAHAIVTADFNQDNKADLAVTSGYYSDVRVFLGNGNGTFQTAVAYSSTGGGIVVEDMNSDGKLDLVTGGNGFSIQLGNGNGTFQAPLYRGYFGNVSQFAVSDFNGDGKPDIASDTYYSSTIAVLYGGCADLSINKTHEGDFIAGGTGMYQITVTNDGNAIAQGGILVHDALPAGLTLQQMYGGGWDCDYQSVTCEFYASLDPGETSFPLYVWVAVANDAPASVVNTATMTTLDASPGNNTATDPTNVVHVPDFGIVKTHTGVFAQGQIGRTYSIVVTNHASFASSAPVTVSDNAPASLTVTDMSGPGWTCNVPSRSCQRNDSLAAQTSYPPITVTVNVAGNAPSTVTNVASVAGGAESVLYNNTYYDQTAILTTPLNLIATALSTTHVYVSWDTTLHATSYQIYRSANGLPYQLIGTAGGNALSDQSVVPNITYLYKVRALASGTLSSFSMSDVATTVMFTDDPLVGGVTKIKVAHVTELRAACSAMRNAAGLAPVTYTNPTITTSTPITALHWMELRNAIAEARSELGLLAVGYSDAVITAGSPSRAAHVRELRAAVK